jgi:hypothetical protein
VIAGNEENSRLKAIRRVGQSKRERRRYREIEKEKEVRKEKTK